MVATFAETRGTAVSDIALTGGRAGRSVYANIQKFIQFQLTVNVAALVINVVAAVSSGDVPLNTVQVCSICTFLYSSCSLVLQGML